MGEDTRLDPPVPAELPVHRCQKQQADDPKQEPDTTENTEVLGVRGGPEVGNGREDQSRSSKRDNSRSLGMGVRPCEESKASCAATWRR